MSESVPVHLKRVPCGCVQVRVDPAGDGDSEESGEFVQRADRAADPDVPAQVNSDVL